MITVFASALSQGLAIATLGFAFALVYWSTRIFFVALGALYALAPFLVAELQSHFGLGGAVALAVTAVTGLSLLSGWANHERLLRKGAPAGVHFACSLALYFLTAELIALRWGSDVRSLATLPGISELVDGRSFLLPVSQLVAIGTCLGLVIAVFLVLRFSGHGVKLRALADNPAELSRSGFNPVLLRAMAFGVSGLVAGGASIAVAVDLAVGAHSGMGALIPAAAATLLTPLGRWRRLLIWALALGLLRTVVTFTISGAWQDPVTLGLLLLGLLGRRQGVRRVWGLRLVPRGAR
jgi:branched-subunit amino acid ABC-type transport system permease component